MQHHNCQINNKTNDYWNSKFLRFLAKRISNKNIVSKTTSPWEIVTGIPLDYKKHYKNLFGSYGKIHEKTNNNTEICEQLGQYVFSPHERDI